MRRSERRTRKFSSFKLKHKLYLFAYIYSRFSLQSGRTEKRREKRTEKYAEITLHNNRKREKLRERNENNTTITKKYAKQMNWG